MKWLQKSIMVAPLAVLALSLSGFAADKATQDLYAAKCAKCHGTDGTATAVGKKLSAKDFSDPEVAKMTDKELTEATANGKGKMPGYGKSLKEDQIKSLVEYVRNLGKKGK